MAVIKKKVNTFEVFMSCSECEKANMKGDVGLMMPTGESIASNPPIYRHKCTKCGHAEDFKSYFPYIEYEIVKDKTKTSGKKVK